MLLDLRDDTTDERDDDDDDDDGAWVRLCRRVHVEDVKVRRVRRDCSHDERVAKSSDADGAEGGASFSADIVLLSNQRAVAGHEGPTWEGGDGERGQKEG